MVSLKPLVQGLREFLLFPSILNPRDLCFLYLGALWESPFLGVNADFFHEYLELSLLSGHCDDPSASLSGLFWESLHLAGERNPN